MRIVFDREAETVEAAVLSAIADVRKAGYQVERIEEGDDVDLAAMAERLGKSRQEIQDLVDGVVGPGDFPLSISGYKTKWSWREVTTWLVAAGLAEPVVAETARVIAVVDAALLYHAAKRRFPALMEAIEDLIR
ncbi:MAG: hypothetical protein BGO49_23735 [Planctomycetales bacterium 71-10]|nr:MAG: hypothetical protein BGO49_23735 [Planctomycetales bacterium 71-10]